MTVCNYPEHYFNLITVMRPESYADLIVNTNFSKLYFGLIIFLLAILATWFLIINVKNRISKKKSAEKIIIFGLKMTSIFIITIFLWLLLLIIISREDSCSGSSFTTSEEVAIDMFNHKASLVGYVEFYFTKGGIFEFSGEKYKFKCADFKCTEFIDISKDQNKILITKDGEGIWFKCLGYDDIVFIEVIENLNKPIDANEYCPEK